LIRTSNIRGINEALLTNAAQVTKVICYTLNETLQYIDGSTDVPDTVILHTLTNDLKTMDPQACAEKLFDIVTSHFNTKWTSTGVIISLATPRLDDVSHFNNSQLINVLIKHKFSDDESVFIADHSNMLQYGNPDKFLLDHDGVHLNKKGTSFLASNTKHATHLYLKIPLYRNTSRSR
jgi:hypothetical protein